MIRVNYAVASGICLILVISLSLANIYPVGYWEQGKLYDLEEGYAGHGYKSLAFILYEGYFWEADDVPVEFEEYQGDGPYYAVGHWWVSILYMPIYLGIIYLGWLLAGGRERLSIILPGREEDAHDEYH